MVYNHTARYYRSKVRLYIERSRPTRHLFKKVKPSSFSKNPELNDLLKRIFYINTYEKKEGESLSRQPIVSFLAFEYSSYNGKLTLSLSMKGQMVNILEVIEEKDIIRTLKTLSGRKIPCWVSKLFDRFQLDLPLDVCLTNISVTDGERTTSVFCFLNKIQTAKKKAMKEIVLIDLDEEEEKESKPSEGKNQQEMAPSNFPAPIEPSNSPDSLDEPSLPSDFILSDDLQAMYLKHKEAPPVEMPPKDQEMAINFKNFLKFRQVMNEAFIFHHDKQETFISSIYSVFAENNKIAIYEMKEVCTQTIMENLIFLKTAEKSEISHLKIMEVDEANRDDINTCVFLLFNEILSNSTYLSLQYTTFCSGEFQFLDVMEFHIIYKDGDRYEYINGTKIEYKFDSEYFRSKEIARIGDVSLNWHSLLTLSPQKWLNDVVIDAYLNLIVQRSKKFNDVLPSVYVFNTYFLQRLKGGRIQPEKFPAADILQSHILLIPCNIKNTHWALFCVDNRKRSIVYYDSLGIPHSTQFFLNKIEEFLLRVAQLNPQLVPSHFPTMRFQKNVGKAVKQSNSFDCGVFVLMHAECLSTDQAFTFSQDVIPLIREQIMDELFNQRLSSENYPSTPSQSLDVGRIGEISLTWNTLLLLSNCNWLNERIIDSYLNLIADRYEKFSDIFPSVYVFNSSFLTALLYGNVELEKYTAADILNFDLLFIPQFSINSNEDSSGEKHWTLFCVDNRKRTILCYDPHPQHRNYSQRDMNMIENFLKSVSSLRPQYQMGLGEAVKQTCDKDSGVFLLMHAEYLSRGEEFNFSQNQMLEIRIHVMYELFIQKLCSPLPDICPCGFTEIPPNIEIGCTNDPFQTLFFNIALGDIVIESYMDFLKYHYAVWVYPDVPDERKSILLFPFRNKRGWALIAINKWKKVLYYYNIPAEGEINDELNLIKLFYRGLQISHWKHEHLLFSEHFVDSGVYVLATTYCLAANITISFGAENIAYLRKKFYWDLKGGSKEDRSVASRSIHN